MKAFMNVTQMKFFSRVLRFLARIGNELYFEATKKGLILRAVNSSKTCFSSVMFLNHFFLSYQMTGDTYDDNNCRVSLRPILSVLKNYKTFIQCQIRLDSKKERVVIDVTKPKDVHKTNYVTILENESLDDMRIPEIDVSSLICHPSVLNDIITTITSKNLREVAFDVKKSNFEIRNHISHPDQDVQTVRLKFKLTPDEFKTYEVENESCLIVSSQDIQAIIEFTEDIKEEMKIIFTENGKPLVISVFSGDYAKVEMFVSSMKEIDLKEIRKAPKTTSYKEVVNTYLESRKSLIGSEAFDVNQMSETEVQRSVSPKVDTCGSLKNLPSASVLRETSSGSIPQKRKSNEILPHTAEDPDETNIEIPESFENHKKQKLDEIQSQEEQEVSQIIADLENMAYEEEDDGIGNPPRNTSSLNFLDGMDKIKVNLRNEQSSQESFGELTQRSVRLDKSKARFATEDLRVDPEPIPNKSDKNERTQRSSLKPVNDVIEKRAKVKRILSVNRNAKCLFTGIIKADGSGDGYGEELAPNSEPESD